ncbi:low temperature requirement protein LtrA [Rhizoctonia solani]|uniref:Low temperature requirement protein LtrA n=1 Tax=Rhizoctonia solani TaxID=456999 RepID=A0A8H8NZV7_9AGAM|nr:low temperature requirement protein LtrA [Rhizoctonia solani]QRW21735.1 low temperature requirement protein LtrA [Rhizoctonia solani]
MTHRRRSSLFLHVKSPPNPNDNPTLWEHRLRQRRPISRNPFEKSVPDGDYGNTVITSSPVIQSEPTKFEEVEAGDPPEEPVKLKSNWDMEWGEQVPSWLNLFFDLAWTATFSSLTSNNKFREPWVGSLNDAPLAFKLTTNTFIGFRFIYCIFHNGMVAMGITGDTHQLTIFSSITETSQVAYNVDFYTDDWFHLIFTFLQLLIFGALAATTRGYDVRNYILRSPGSSELETYDIITINPERYSTERLTKISLRVITFVLAMSRVFLLIQHLRVVIYAKITAKANRLPRQLFIVPATLVISTGLFVTAFLTTIAPKGTEPYGAKIKYACWGSAVLVEMVAHIIRFQLDLNRGIRLRSHGSITGRLSDITTIILGEGMNAIAGTFYAIEQAPGISVPTGSSVICCGVKNQLLLVNFLNSVDYIMLGISKSIKIADEAQLNATMRPLLLQAGLSFDREYSKLDDMISSNFSQYASLPNETATAFGDEITQVWYLRIQLSATLNTYLNYMENDTIPETVYSTIRSYQTDYNFTLEDLKVSKATNPPQLPHFGQIQEALVEPSIGNARYIMAMYRFHWASVFSRYTMGVCMILLLFLNIGSVQAYVGWNEQQLSRRAGVFKWIDATCVLPTLALAYAIHSSSIIRRTYGIKLQALVYAAVWHSRKVASQEK